MKQVDILKYAYVGALETVESYKKATIGSKESREMRIEQADRDFKEIRDLMFAAISEETGIDFKEEIAEAIGEPAKAEGAEYAIFLRSEGGPTCLYMSDLTEEQAKRICNEHDWSIEDENGFVWLMEYEEQPF